jgi:hypothetical protein
MEFSEDAIGAPDHQKCRASTQPENMYTKHKVKAVVSGYDEENQWLVLASPSVHSERVE